MNKFACVTGADRGVGFGLVSKLLHEGYYVFAGKYLKELNLLDNLKDQFKERLYIVDLDISDNISVKNAAEFIKSKTDKIDVLINNAAILGEIEKDITEELDFEEIQKVYNVNALGPLRVSNALISLILNGDSKLIINISSEAGSIGNCYRKSWFAYCMSKTALNMESALIHNGIKDMGGQVIAIHPGWVKTYMQGKLDEAAEITPEASAEGIVKIIYDHKKYKGENPVYIDYLGNKMEW